MICFAFDFFFIKIINVFLLYLMYKFCNFCIVGINMAYAYVIVK